MDLLDILERKGYFFAKREGFVTNNYYFYSRIVTQ